MPAPRRVAAQANSQGRFTLWLLLGALVAAHVFNVVWVGLCVSRCSGWLTECARMPGGLQ